jgi:hypothetical protein
MRLPSSHTMNKAKQTTLIALVLVIGFAFNMQAFADTYQFFEGIDNTSEGRIYGIDSAGTMVTYQYSCITNPESCYKVWVDGLFSYTTATPPALNYDDGTLCPTPAGFNALSTTVCNNGRVVFGARNNPNGDPGGLYVGPYSDPQKLIDAPLIPDTPFLFLNSAGDFAYANGTFEILIFALDLTTHQTPEPTSLVLLSTGVLGLIGVARRKFVSIS